MKDRSKFSCGCERTSRNTFIVRVKGRRPHATCRKHRNERERKRLNRHLLWRNFHAPRKPKPLPKPEPTPEYKAELAAAIERYQAKRAAIHEYVQARIRGPWTVKELVSYIAPSRDA